MNSQQQQKSSDWPRFREAPSFRNGAECTTIIHDPRAPGSGTNQRRQHGSASSTTESSSADIICDPRLVHIAMTLDIAYIRGSMAAVLSIVQHATCPENVAFHFITSSSPSSSSSSSSSIDPMEDLSRLITSTFPYLAFRIYPFNASLVREKISPTVREALEQPLNYARAYLADILPECVAKLIYLDSDVVVLGDIAELYGTDLAGMPLAAAEHCRANFTRYFTDGFWADIALSGAAAFATGGRESTAPCYFNTGVMVMDLWVWRSGGYTREIERWMEVQKERRIYELGSLPPFLLVFAGRRLRRIEERWNQHGLGGDNVRGACRGLHPGPISLLHWSGKGKPWVRLDAHTPCPLDSLWAPYDLAFVSDNKFDE